MLDGDTAEATREQHESCENEPAKGGSSDGEEQSEYGREDVKLNLDFERPRHKIDVARPAKDRIMDVEYAREQIRKQAGGGAPPRGDFEHEEQNEAQHVGWFETSYAPPKILLQRQRLPQAPLRLGKRQTENEPADHKKQRHPHVENLRHLEQTVRLQQVSLA